MLPMLESHAVGSPHVVPQFELYALHTIVLRDPYDFLDVIAYQHCECDGGTGVLLNGP